MAERNLTPEEHNERRRAQKAKQKAAARKGSTGAREEKRDNARFAPAYRATVVDKVLIEEHMASGHDTLTHRTIVQKFLHSGLILEIQEAKGVGPDHEDPILGKHVSAEPDGFYLVTETGSKVSIPFTRRIFVMLDYPIGLVFNRIRRDDGTFRVNLY